MTGLIFVRSVPLGEQFCFFFCRYRSCFFFQGWDFCLFCFVYCLSSSFIFWIISFYCISFLDLTYRNMSSWSYFSSSGELSRKLVARICSFFFLLFSWLLWGLLLCFLRVLLLLLQDPLWFWFGIFDFAIVPVDLPDWLRFFVGVGLHVCYCR